MFYSVSVIYCYFLCLHGVCADGCADFFLKTEHSEVKNGGEELYKERFLSHGHYLYKPLQELYSSATRTSLHTTGSSTVSSDSDSKVRNRVGRRCEIEI